MKMKVSAIFLEKKKLQIYVSEFNSIQLKKWFIK